MNISKGTALASVAVGAGMLIGGWKGTWVGIHRAEEADQNDPSTRRRGTYGDASFHLRMLVASGASAALGLATAVGGAALLVRGSPAPAAIGGAALLGLGAGAVASGGLGLLGVAAARYLEFPP